MATESSATSPNSDQKPVLWKASRSQDEHEQLVVCFVTYILRIHAVGRQTDHQGTQTIRLPSHAKIGLVEEYARAIYISKKARPT